MTGIGGTYGLHLKNVQDELTELVEPVHLKVHVLKDKSVSDKTVDCEITAVSVSQIEIRTGGSLQIYDNLMIDTVFDLYAKVVRIDGNNSYTLAFTAKGEGFDRWIGDLNGQC